MQSTTHLLSTTYTRYLNSAGDLIGVVYAIPGVNGRGYYLAEAHDWDSDDNPAGAFLPIVAEVSDDPEQCVAAIERRARAAQAPDSVNVTL